MKLPLVARAAGKAIALQVHGVKSANAWRAKQSVALRRWLDVSGFAGKSGDAALLPGGKPAAIAVAGDDASLWDYAALAARLPRGIYRLATPLASPAAERLALGWAVHGYRFGRYKANAGPKIAQLAWPDGVDRARVGAAAEAIFLARDLINTPAGDMGPEELAAAAQALARKFGAKCQITSGEKLRKEWPLVHAVGRASSRPPRLVDLRWGPENAPRITLVGKGVCFDSGGLDLKPASGMLTMKKDMGGAAHVLGLAHMLMAARLRLRLRVLIPAVENAVSGNAFRPLDVIKSRKGITVEIGNTDAEGRLILCDCLHEAALEKPAMIVDFATLTGAARVALGAELPAMFCNDDALAEALLKSGKQAQDPLWRMPLHRPYRRHLDSKIADINNVGGDFGGAITAALFLQEFVPDTVPWAHFDIMAWNQADRPGRPQGGEAMGLRAVYGAIVDRIGG